MSYEQKITYARASLWLPYYAVGMAARIQGNVPPELVESALRKLCILYPPLASRVRVEQDGSAWLTAEGVGEFSLEVREKTSDNDWVALFLEQEKLPFNFERGPLARFFLLRGEQSSDLVAVVPHVICDGYSMTLVMWDAVALLNDPDREVTPPVPPPLVTWQTIPHSPFDNLLLRGLARLLNRVWPKGRVVVRQKEYMEFHQQYWSRQHNDALFFQLSPEETSSLLARCKQRGVSVSGALAAAFLLAREGDWPAEFADCYEFWVPVNIRDRLTPPPDRVVGIYASAINLRLHPKAGISFWELARECHARIHKGMENRAKILQTLVLDELDPRIADGLGAAQSTNRWSREYKLLSRLIKVTGEARCLNLSNIGRMDLPEAGSSYRLETLLPFPPIAPSSRLSLNVLTVNGRLNAVLKYRQDQFDRAAITRIKDRALSYLSGGS
jgi:hypothetical protein